MPYLDSDGSRIYYEVYGKGPPLVFIHGYFLDIRCYRDLLNNLGSRYEVYALDLPGHGKSGDILPNCSIRQMVTQIRKSIEALNIKNPVLFGHSAGALLALYYASIYKVKRLIISSPPGIKYYRTKLPLLLKFIFLHPIVCFVTNPLRSIPMFLIIFQNISRNISQKFYLKLLRVIINNEPKLKISVKTIILWPKYDIFFSSKFADYYLKKIKDSRLFIIPSTHEWLSLDPEKIYCMGEII